MWERMFSHFGLRLPPERHPTSLEPGWTHAYFNTGVILVPPGVLQRLHDRWLHYIHDLLEARGAVPGLADHPRGRVPEADGAIEAGMEHLYFAEQWAFALARAELELPYAVLPLALNFPSITRAGQRLGAYIDARFLPHAIEPLLLHHHHELADRLPPPATSARTRRSSARTRCSAASGCP